MFVDKPLLTIIEKKLFITYTLIVICFIALFAIPFSDRVGILAWSIYPILIGSFLGKFKYKPLNTNFLIGLVITLFGLASFYFYPAFKIGYFFSDLL